MTLHHWFQKFSFFPEWSRAQFPDSLLATGKNQAGCSWLWGSDLVTLGIWLCFTRLQRRHGVKGCSESLPHPRNRHTEEETTPGQGTSTLGSLTSAWCPLSQAAGTISQCRKREVFPSAVGFFRKIRVLHLEPDVMGWMFEKCAACLRDFLNGTDFIHHMVCWATIGPDTSGATNTVIKLVNSGVLGTHFSASFAGRFWWLFSTLWWFAAALWCLWAP